MALMPKRVKHRKSQRGRIKGNATRGNRVVFGDLWPAINTSRLGQRPDDRSRTYRGPTIPPRRRSTLHTHLPDKSVSSIPLETRMGKGKGEPDFWAATVRPGTVLCYEIGGTTEEAARVCFRRLAYKMPVATRLL